MMAIWYSCDNKNKKYLKFILFNNRSVKIVSNYQIKRELQTQFIFKDASKFLDCISALFELPFIELAELSQFIIEEY